MREQIDEIVCGIAAACCAAALTVIVLAYSVWAIGG